MRAHWLPLLLSGCALAQIDGVPRPGRAVVEVAHMPNGKSAVAVYGINTKHRFHSQPVKDVKSFVIGPGTYLLDVDCMRPGATVIVDGSFDFVFSVEADKTYLLDCTPQPGMSDDGFYVSERGR